MSIGWKQALLVGLPILALLILGFTTVNQKRATLAEMAKVEQMSAVAQKISLLVHALQKERGSTGVFVSSGGAKHADRLPELRADTDGFRDDLKSHLESIDLGAISAEFESALNDSLDMLTQLDPHRKQVDNLTISVPDSISYFTRQDESFLRGIATMTHATTDGEVTTMIAAYLSFLESKERAGQERAVVGPAFTTNEMNEAQFRKFLGLINKQDAFDVMFLALADEAAIAKFNTLPSEPTVIKANEYRAWALTREPEELKKAEGGEWFDVMTAKITR